MVFKILSKVNIELYLKVTKCMFLSPMVMYYFQQKKANTIAIEAVLII